jgi:chromatin segregation and condensation protein Rec8/ScpA/Scc1 (kleisin family)
MAKSSEITRSQIGPLGVFSPPEIHIECAAFTGTLGVLFTFVRDKKVDLLDIPLAPICLAYAEYLAASQETELEGSAVAATVLAYMLERKAHQLLPSTHIEEEEEPEIEGIDPTSHLYAPAVRALQQRLEEREQLFFRSGDPADMPYELPLDTESVTTDDLARALESLLARAQPDPVEPLGRPRRSLSEQMGIVLAALPQQPETLDKIVVGEFTRSEVVWWFLALLELIRLGQAVVVMQESMPAFGRSL